jgi:putative NIF3 family GTP cyclohydrolase 1 type 2
MNTPIQPDASRGKSWKRREFVTTLITTAGAFPLLFVPGAGEAMPPKQPADPLTVQQIIDLILKSIPDAPFTSTVDTIKAGSADTAVTGIVTTMFATNEVIEKAAALGANFIIAHEPTFYNHPDDTNWLRNNPEYEFKSGLLKKHNMVIWRFHDYIHAHKPDGVLMGVLTALGWEKQYDAQKPNIITIPSATLRQIIELFKKKLHIEHVKVIGDLSQSCNRIALVPGAAGGKRQIEILEKEKPDLLIVGELNEWETSEYVRDARFMGSQTALLVLGHIVSEEPGLEWTVQWLQPQLPNIKITHIPSGDAFKWV